MLQKYKDQYKEKYATNEVLLPHYYFGVLMAAGYNGKEKKNSVTLKTIAYIKCIYIYMCV